jgi:hypothetical protein
MAFNAAAAAAHVTRQRPTRPRQNRADGVHRAPGQTNRKSVIQTSKKDAVVASVLMSQFTVRLRYTGMSELFYDDSIRRRIEKLAHTGITESPSKKLLKTANRKSENSF